MHLSSPRRTLVAATVAAALTVLAPSVGDVQHLAPAGAAVSRPADAAGSLPLGGARYAVPAGAVFASPAGSDAYSGSANRPVRTIRRALALVPTGGTIVLRRGTFHESVTVTKAGVTIQNYPGEAVWLDGSVPVTRWTKTGTVWSHDRWYPRFDASPSFTKGGADGTAEGWRFVNPAYPMAAHPDMVFVNGVSQLQVTSLRLVRPGRFFLDTATSRLYLGTTPTGARVEASSLAHAVSVRAPNVQLRGFGIRRFADSIWHIGGVTLEQPGAVLANMKIEQMATIGVGAIASDILLSSVDVTGSGLLGLHAATADRLRVLHSRVSGNNTERFNTAPVSGGIKVGRLRTVTVSQSQLNGNYGPGFWADQSTYDMRLTRNNIDANTGAGVFLEISALATLVDNLVTRNAGNGIKVNNTSDVRIWNNTVVSNNREINIVADSRLASNTSWGHDPRQPYPDPTMTWILGPVEVRNTIIGRPRAGNCLLCVEDYTFTRTAAEIGVTSGSNLYNRSALTAPTWTQVWSSGTTRPYVYTSLLGFQRSTGQERSSLGYDGTIVVALTGALTSTARTASTSRAAALPSDIAALAGQPTGTRRMGVWGR